MHKASETHFTGGATSHVDKILTETGDLELENTTTKAKHISVSQE